MNQEQIDKIYKITHSLYSMINVDVSKYKKGSYTFSGGMANNAIPTHDIDRPCLLQLDDGKYVKIDKFIAPLFPNRGLAYHFKKVISLETIQPEGTPEWALQMMLLGGKVAVYSQPNRFLWLSGNRIQDSDEHGYWNGKSHQDFISYAAKTGWQIYEPQTATPEPDQIVETNEMVKPERSIENALSLLKEGKSVIGAYWGEDVIVSPKGQLDYEVISVENFGKRQGTPITEQEFINHAESTNWRVYEPETKPLLADAQVGDLVEVEASPDNFTMSHKCLQCNNTQKLSDYIRYRRDNCKDKPELGTYEQHETLLNLILDQETGESV